MVLPPFKDEGKQKVISATVLMIGVVLIANQSWWELTLFSFVINMLMIGVFVAFFGLLYLMDAL